MMRKPISYPVMAWRTKPYFFDFSFYSSISHSQVILLRTLITLCSTLNPLPKQRWITMQLYYYDDITVSHSHIIIIITFKASWLPTQVLWRVNQRFHTSRRFYLCLQPLCGGNGKVENSSALVCCMRCSPITRCAWKCVWRTISYRKVARKCKVLLNACPSLRRIWSHLVWKHNPILKKPNKDLSTTLPPVKSRRDKKKKSKFWMKKWEMWFEQSSNQIVFISPYNDSFLSFLLLILLDIMYYSPHERRRSYNHSWKTMYTSFSPSFIHPFFHILDLLGLINKIRTRYVITHRSSHSHPPYF